MSLRRLATTAAVMAVAAMLLAALTSGLPDPAALAHPQAFVDEAGAEAFVVTAVGLAAWGAWAWGVLGLLLTALSAVPGLAGAVARAAGRLVLPASARRAAAVALGVGLAVGAPALSACSTGAQPAAAVESLAAAGPVPDWPTTPVSPQTTGPTAPPPAAGPVPDWTSTEHVVVRGDCLWEIAAADLRARTGVDPAPPEIARAVAAWWAANRDVIGHDPDLLLPGQVLRAPADPTVTGESENRR